MDSIIKVNAELQEEAAKIAGAHSYVTDEHIEKAVDAKGWSIYQEEAPIVDPREAMTIAHALLEVYVPEDVKVTTPDAIAVYNRVKAYAQSIAPTGAEFYAKDEEAYSPAVHME